MEANQVLGQLLRAYRDRYTFMRIYKQYVRLHMEDCIQAWSPWLQQDIDLLENVQQRAIKAVSGLSGSYEEKLKTLKMQPLQERRVRGDMIQDIQDSQRNCNIDANKFSISAEQHSYSTRQATTVTDNTYVPTPTHGLLKGSSKLTLRSNLFSQRVVQPWNLLPPVIKQTDSDISFKDS